MRIGIFDSGIGGEAVASNLRKIMPNTDIITVNDHRHVPYGNRSADEIIRLTKLAIVPLIKSKCDVIVIACNTATAVAISSLRLAYPDQNLIGIEPMIKPAALATKTGSIAVCATPLTLKSSRYQELKQTWASNVKVIEPDCSSWANLIEHGKSNQIDVVALVNNLIKNNVDVVVLGCTHFHWLKQSLIETAPRMTVMEPSDSIADRIKKLVNI